MASVTESEIVQFVEQHIGQFHASRLEALFKLRLKKGNYILDSLQGIDCLNSIIALDAITDMVLAYRPGKKSKPRKVKRASSKKRKEGA